MRDRRSWRAILLLLCCCLASCATARLDEAADIAHGGGLDARRFDAGPFVLAGWQTPGKAEGGTLTVWMKGGKYMLTDEKGGMAAITIPNVYQSNGVIQVIDTVLMP